MHTKIDKALFNALRPILAQAARDLGDTLGINVALGSASYARDEASGSIKLELSAVAADGTVLTKEASHFRQEAHFHGFKPDDLGREFTSNGKRFRVSGLRTKARTKPILAVEVATGKEYIWPADTVKLYLGRETPAGSKA